MKCMHHGYHCRIWLKCYQLFLPTWRNVSQKQWCFTRRFEKKNEDSFAQTSIHRLLQYDHRAADQWARGVVEGNDFDQQTPHCKLDIFCLQTCVAKVRQWAAEQIFQMHGSLLPILLFQSTASYLWCQVVSCSEKTCESYQPKLL